MKIKQTDKWACRCDYKPGDSCKFLDVTYFTPSCIYYKERLYHDDAWCIKRNDDCIREGTKEKMKIAFPD